MASTGGMRNLKTLSMMLTPPKGANTTGSLAEAMSPDWYGKGEAPTQSMDPDNWVSAVQAADADHFARTGKHLAGLSTLLLSMLGQYQENTKTGERRPALPAAAVALPQMPEMIGRTAQRALTKDYPPTVEDPVTGRMYNPAQYEDANLLASLAMTGGMPLAAPENTLRMFAGVTAKTADKEALKLAQHMHASGVPREEIWKRTGWYKAPDGKWKFEIDDSRAFFRDYAMPRVGPSGEVPETALRNVLTHDELYKAYPELANVPVSPETSGNAVGSFNGTKMTINSTPIMKQTPLSTALHEGQHFIEEVEDFGRGGNKEFVANHPDPVVQEAYQRKFDSRFNFAPLDQWRQTYASRLAGKPEDEIIRLYELQRDFMEGRKFNPNDQLTIDARRGAASGTYRDLAGEAEARNTQARMKMNAKERRETPPWMTLDVPEHAHITTFETPYGGANAELPVQAISSAKTSLRQVPALLKSKVFDAAPGSRNLDLGGGAYDMGTEYLANERGVKSYVLDPFNRPDEHNKAVAAMFKKDPADTVTVANVLNVIKEPEARLGVIKQAYDNVKPGGKVYFDIYEGNRSGTGAVTSKGFQNNASAQFYLDEIKKMFPDVQRKGTVLIATKPMAAR